MLKIFKQFLKNKEQGFTVIELMVVIGIMGVLGAVALPIFLNQQNESTRNSIRSDVRNTISNVATYVSANPSTPVPNLASPTTVGDAYQIVYSSENIVTVQGTTQAGEYIVEGSSPLIPDYFYNFDSRTGLYSTTTTPSNN